MPNPILGIEESYARRNLAFIESIKPLHQKEKTPMTEYIYFRLPLTDPSSLFIA
jgi:hypothetical protein